MKLKSSSAPCSCSRICVLLLEKQKPLREFTRDEE
uniref:Uncharacterized protein n=1 Tax=Arundo donax TaxID=35708 RepID=A0A0A9B0U1_ARUDO